MNQIRPFYIFNTLSRHTEEFKPITPGQVGIYCCGPTVYNYQHIGNLKTYLFEDLLVRTLRYIGYQVKHVMNVTDVGHLVSDADEGEDKMLVAMRREKKRSSEVAKFYADKFFEDCAKLNITRPNIVCYATDHIKEMIGLIQRLEANGFTYVSNGNVYFDVAKFSKYGELAKLDLEKLKAGARIEIDKNKKGPFDFGLWFTKSKFENQELLWDSPWGAGYPGWHIECSAMSIKHIGEQIDIHCGGIDHIPVHHTNEIAQSEAATGKPWVHYWVHGEFMQINAEKMSKSKANFFILDDLINRGYDPLVFRYLALGSHYRSQLNFTWEVVENAKNAFARLKSQVLALKKQSAPAEKLSASANNLLDEFRAAICDDLNVPKAMAAANAALNAKDLSAGEKLAVLHDFDQVLGLGIAQFAEESVALTPELQALLDERQKARAQKNWAESDRLREAIAALGYVVKDSAAGQSLVKK